MFWGASRSEPRMRLTGLAPCTAPTGPRQLQVAVWLLIASALAVAGAAPAGAYSNDTHFGFTYFMARSTGYSPDQARKVASACAALDLASNPDVEPAQMDDALGDKAQSTRVLFHAMLDQRRFPDYWDSPEQFGAACAARDETGTRLAAYCRDVLHNPGIYLHFLQDRYSHWGYGCRWGHYNPLDALLPDRLAFGSATDYLSYDPEVATPQLAAKYHFPARRNQSMVLASLELLRSALPGQARTVAHPTLKGGAKLSAPPPAARCDPKCQTECLALLTALQKANPYPTHRKDFQKEQDFAAADAAINRALQTNGYPDRLPPVLPIHITTDANGQIVPDPELLRQLKLD